MWSPVLPLLEPHRRAIVVDLPGHGDSPPPTPAAAADPAGYATAVGELLDDLRLAQIDVVGNSIGGWTALELARLGRARSVVALSPAGLWPRLEPTTRRVRFVADHFAARLTLPLLTRAMRWELARQLIASEAMTSARRLSPSDAAAIASDYARVKDLPTHVRARRGQRFTGGRDLTVPITIAWGSRDRLIPPAARSRDELPAHAKWIDLPGCGHVPMWDNPALVAETILTGVQ